MKITSILFTVLFIFSANSISFAQPNYNKISAWVDLKYDESYSFQPDSFQFEPIVGKIEFLRGFYKSLRYPASARNNGIQGTVILEVFVDKEGSVEKVNIHQSLQTECDQASLNSFMENITAGFKPYSINNQYYRFNLFMPVKFRLE